ncbi:protein of unknown function [Taphrina deformans PYCC 5710]|uniref:Uncharacterized protein n=1 Tax=Taphrina deformans (strain PYCC 5710 / ATCC 11124 / CBS 356.35 / IMI 108563 / JCM 9778 / NBRC 8474) TaxID=1097556 RepID=R4XPT6_TAPDE|nr:protein of unknown function [Taphrina deformans PYCC 5710]|eukprot:CCG85191.1 protein of unknown function [Taphrina deformans PYCC 5710]
MKPALLYAFLLADLCTARIVAPNGPDQVSQDTKSPLAITFDQNHVEGLPAHAAVSHRVRKQLLHRFSPVIYLHPDDQYLPADPADTFKRYYDPVTDSMSIPETELSGLPLSYDDEEEIRGSSLQARHINHHQSLTYSPITVESPLSNKSVESYNEFHRPSARSGRARVTAPVTSQARVLTRGRNAGKILLQYWYWHHFNGAQGFSVKSKHGRNRDADDLTRWEWWPLAIHNADWEHTTITLSPTAASSVSLSDVLRGRFSASDYELESVYYTVHAEVEDKLMHFDREGNHPVVYSHLNSHACYAVPGDYWNKDPGFDGFINSVVRFLSFGRIEQIRIVDIGFDPKEAIRWADYKIYDISEASEGNAPDWALWKGHWGDAVDQTLLSAPPSYVPSRMALRFTMWLLKVFGKLRKFVKPHKKAPKGPVPHWNWGSLDVLADDWVPRVKAGPNKAAIAGFLVCMVLSLGSIIVTLSCLAIVVLVASRLVARKLRPRTKLLAMSLREQHRRGMQHMRAWQKTHELESGGDDEDVAERLLPHDGSAGRPSESFDTERPARRKFEWIREACARVKKGIV